MERLTGNERMIIKDKVQRLAEAQKPDYFKKMKEEKGDEAYNEWWKKSMISEMVNTFLSTKTRPCCFEDDCYNATWSDKEMLYCPEHAIKRYNVTNAKMTVGYQRQVTICKFVRDGIKHSVAVPNITDLSKNDQGHGLCFPFELCIVSQVHWPSSDVYDIGVVMLQQAREEARNVRIQCYTANLEERAAQRRAATELALKVHKINNSGEKLMLMIGTSCPPTQMMS